MKSYDVFHHILRYIAFGIRFTPNLHISISLDMKARCELQGVSTEMIHFTIGNIFVSPGDIVTPNNTFSNNNVIAICAMLRIFTLHWICVDNLDCFKSTILFPHFLDPYLILGALGPRQNK